MSRKFDYSVLMSTLFSFFVSLGIFILIRVLGVLYFADLFEEIVDFSAFSAINILNWFTILISWIISNIAINLVLRMDRNKVFLDSVTSIIVVIAIYGVIGYNWVGYSQTQLFYTLTYFDKAIRFTFWITVFAVDTFVDIFVFWLLVSVVFFIILTLLLYIDIETLFEKGIRIKRQEKIKIKTNYINIIIHYILIFVVLMIVMMINYVIILEFPNIIHILLFSLIMSSIILVFYILIYNQHMSVKMKGLYYFITVTMTFFVIITILQFQFILINFIFSIVVGIVSIMLTRLKK